MPQIYLTNQLKNIRQNRQRLEYLLNLGEKTDNSTIVSIQADNQLLINHVMLMWESLTNTDKKLAQSIKDDIDREFNECNRILTAANRELNPELMGNWGKLFSQIALVMGFLLIWIYCFFQINYFPSGFSIGEISFLVFVSLGFGLLFFVCTCLLWVSAFLLKDFYYSSKKLNSINILIRDYIDIFLNFLMCSLIIWIWLILCQTVLWLDRQQTFIIEEIYSLLWGACLLPSIYFMFAVRNIIYWLVVPIFLLILAKILNVCTYNENLDFYYPIVSMVIIFAIWGVSWISSKSIKYDLVFKICSQIVIICGVLIAFKSVTSFVFNTTFESFGIRHNHISISLSEDDHKKVKALAKEQNLPLLFSCEDENQTILNHTNVLWNGMGEHILLGIPSLKKNQDVATIEVKKSDSKILRGIQSNQGCTYHKLEKAFESGQAILDTEAKKELFKDMDNLLSQSKISLTYIEISAFSDLTPYKGKGMNNLQLSEKRAENVKNEIENKYCKENKNQNWCKQISIKSMGNSKPTSSCLKTGHDKKDVANCRADDRSVLIKLTWKVPDNNNGKENQEKNKATQNNYF